MSSDSSPASSSALTSSRPANATSSPAPPSPPITPPPSQPSASPPPSKSNNSSSPSPSPPSPPSLGEAPAPLSHSSRVLSPPASNGGSSPSSAGASHGGLSIVTEIALAAVGAALLLVLLIAACVCCSGRKKKRRKPHNTMMYYTDTSGYKGNSTYYTSGMQPQWKNTTGGAPSMNWQSQSPPLPSDTSAAAYSGSPHGALQPPPPPDVGLGLSKSSFSYEELAAATGNFSPANLLGQGGFGYVYKGVLPGGRDVAVKQLKAGSGQGEREFQAEVDIISRVHHRNLVSLVGYCSAGVQRVLVYEFVPNKTLEYHLHGKGLPVMEWRRRLRIATGSAKGLAYLHEDCHPRIIHRDIKSANILLDNNFEAMVADFGLAKLRSDNHTHVSTRVMGTFGYLAPEYASSGKLTEKSDVFSYGVMLLELLTGRRPYDAGHSFAEDSLVDWARPVLSSALADGNYDELADPRLNGNYESTEMARMVACAAACVRHSARRRPKMSQTVRALEGSVSLEDLNEGVRPGQSMLFSSRSSSSAGSASDFGSSGSYTSNMDRIRRAALPSPDFNADYDSPIPEFDPPSPTADGTAFSDEPSPAVNQRHRAHHRQL